MMSLENGSDITAFLEYMRSAFLGGKMVPIALSLYYHFYLCLFRKA